MSGLRDAVKKLNEAITDLSSLHVQTFTGTVAISSDTTGFDNIRSAIQSAQTNSEITLVAEAYYQFDGDSYNFIATDANGAITAPPAALELHKSAVEAGMQTRLGLIELVKDAFGA